MPSRHAAQAAGAENRAPGIQPHGHEYPDVLPGGPAHRRAAALNPGNRFEKVRLHVLGDYLDEQAKQSDLFGAAGLARVPLEVYADQTRQLINRVVPTSDMPFDWTASPYRGCEHGCIYCLSGDTAVWMADGTTQRIGDINRGDEIYGTVRRGRYRRLVKTCVLAHWQVRKRAHRITLNDGTQLVASADHRFLTRRGWKCVKATPKSSRASPHLTCNDRLIGIADLGCEPMGSDGMLDYLSGALAIGRTRQLRGAAVKPKTDLTIAAIEPLGSVRQLFDMTTGTGDFIANGVVSHNCFARPYHEYLGFSCGLDFETKIMAKFEAPQLLRRELAAPRWTGEPIVMSAITDVYQPLEYDLRLTRGCLEVLAQCGQPVSIMTKGALILRDLELLTQLARQKAVRVAVTLPTVDAQLAVKLEPRATLPAGRLRIIRELSTAGVPVSILVAPVIPGLTDKQIPQILEAAAEAGAQQAGWVMLRLPYQLKALFLDWLQRWEPRRATHIESLIRQTQGGKLYEADKNRRRGRGDYADHIAQVFNLFARRNGLNRKVEPLSRDSFRKPALHGQMSLFG